MRATSKYVFVSHLSKKIQYGLAILLLAISTSSSATEKLTLSAIYDLKNPYKKTFDVSGLVEDSKEFIHLSGLSDRFDLCQTEGMITFIAFANHIEVMRKYDSPESKFEAMKYMATKRNLEYPFNDEEIAESSLYRVNKLAIEMGWKYPGSSDEHLESIASIFWEKCMELPISIFEAEWLETEDSSVFDNDDG